VEQAIRDAKHTMFRADHGMVQNARCCARFPLAYFKQTLVKAWYVLCAAKLETAAGGDAAAALAATEKSPFLSRHAGGAAAGPVEEPRQFLQTLLSAPVAIVIQTLVFALSAAA